MADKTNTINQNIMQIYCSVLKHGYKIEEVKEEYRPGKSFKLYNPNGGSTSWRIWLLPADWWKEWENDE